MIAMMLAMAAPAPSVMPYGPRSSRGEMSARIALAPMQEMSSPSASDRPRFVDTVVTLCYNRDMLTTEQIRVRSLTDAERELLRLLTPDEKKLALIRAAQEKQTRLAAEIQQSEQTSTPTRDE